MNRLISIISIIYLISILNSCGPIQNNVQNQINELEKENLKLQVANQLLLQRLEKTEENYKQLVIKLNDLLHITQSLRHNTLQSTEETKYSDSIIILKDTSLNQLKRNTQIKGKNQKTRHQFTDIGNGFAVKKVNFRTGILGGTNIMGEIQNNSGKDYKTVCLKISLYDKNEDLVDIGTAILTQLKTGSIKSFDGSAQIDKSKIADYKVQFETGY